MECNNSFLEQSTRYVVGIFKVVFCNLIEQGRKLRNNPKTKVGQFIVR